MKKSPSTSLPHYGTVVFMTTHGNGTSNVTKWLFRILIPSLIGTMLGRVHHVNVTGRSQAQQLAVLQHQMEDVREELARINTKLDKIIADRNRDLRGFTAARVGLIWQEEPRMSWFRSGFGSQAQVKKSEGQAMCSKKILQIIQALQSRGLAAPSDCIGCDASEIRAFEQTVSAPLPQIYREFLRRLGKRGGKMFHGVDATYPSCEPTAHR